MDHKADKVTGKKRSRRAAWFKLWLSQRPLVEAMPDAAVGQAFKAAYRYFDTGEVTELDLLPGAVFAVLKAQADDAADAYVRSVEAGIAGAAKRWGSKTEDSPPMAPLSHAIGVDAEDRREKIEDNIYRCAVSLLNQLTGSSFRDSTKATRKAIRARQNEGYTLEDLQTVIRHQCSLWGQDERMRKYLRPQTLFGTKFEAYLSDARRSGPSGEPGYILAPAEDPWETAVKEGYRV